MTDDQLMQLAAAGNESAIRMLVQRWEASVHAFLCRMLGDPEEARDLTQDTFVRLFRHAGRYEADGRFRAWLFRIAGNMGRSRLRRRKLVRWLSFDLGQHDVVDPRERADGAVHARELQERFRAALARLPVRQREAIVLKHDQDMSHREIAAVIGTTPKAVESLLQRATAALRDSLSGVDWQ